jgi:2-hydroxychromene-2-carboxylate isomerase
VRQVIVYTDFKSPYAYLAQAEICELADGSGVSLDWRPYTLDIPSYLGSAELDEQRRVIGGQRDAHQWRKVRYAYMDCRRQATRRGLTILGTRKIWDSSLAAIGLLWAKRQGETVLRAYADLTFERFWRRALDIEDLEVVGATLAEAGAEVAGFPAFLAGEGRAELYWGREHLPDIQARLLAGGD